MVKKKTLITGLVILICLLAIFTGYLIIGEVFSNSYENLTLSDTCSCMVPSSNIALNEKSSVKAYEDTNNNLTVVYFNTNSSSGIDLMSSVANKTLVGDAKLVDGVSVHYDSKTGVYSIFVVDTSTHDCVLIASKDVDLLLKVYNSLTFKDVPLAQNSHLSHDIGVLTITTTSTESSETTTVEYSEV
ncbi:MAG: hypothetical protein MJ209_06180 [archaeon]|nr:hypothetical protein [archaeon]